MEKRPGEDVDASAERTRLSTTQFQSDEDTCNTVQGNERIRLNG